MPGNLILVLGKYKKWDPGYSGYTGVHFVLEVSDLGHGLILALRAPVSRPGMVSAGELESIWTGIKNSVFDLQGDSYPLFVLPARSQNK